MLIVVCWFTCAKKHSLFPLHVCVCVYVWFYIFIWTFVCVCVCVCYTPTCKNASSLSGFLCAETTNCRVGRFRWGTTKKKQSKETTTFLNYNIYYASSIVKNTIFFTVKSSLYLSYGFKKVYYLKFPPKYKVNDHKCSFHNVV